MKKGFQFIFAMLAMARLTAQDNISFQCSFAGADTLLVKTGRGLCRPGGGILYTKDASASFGDTAWTDYEVRFSARAPASASQVQIWAGFRAVDRQDYYSLGFRGGEQNTFYLARRGYMGRDEFLALRPLGFHPIPGKWYDFRIAVSGDRIRVFLDKESLPRIDITDKNSRILPSGKVILGGGWIETEYARLSVKGLSRDQWAGKPAEELDFAGLPLDKQNGATLEPTGRLTAGDKQKQRRTEREA